MKVVLTVDVEEPGLFRGRYPSRPPGPPDLAGVVRLAALAAGFGLPLTLLVTYPVLADPAAAATLARLAEGGRGELGAHLHPWNTPPFHNHPWPEPILADRLGPELVRAKLANLTSAFRRVLGQSPTSFRMGRFDWSRQVLAALPGLGISVDASLAPWVNGLSLTGPVEPFTLPSGLLEVPLTGRAVWPGLARGVEGLARRLKPAAGRRLRRGFLRIGWVGLAPAWYPLASLKVAARLHRRRDGRVLVLFLHSGELTPGEHPRLPDRPAVDRVLGRLERLLAWLNREMAPAGLTLSALPALGFPSAELDPAWWSLAGG